MKSGGLSVENAAAAWGRSPESTGLDSHQGAEKNLSRLSMLYFDRWIDQISACPWGAHAGMSPWGVDYKLEAESGGEANKSSYPSKIVRAPLYTKAERARRDASPWTLVQGILAPLQFLICAASLLLIVRYLVTGQGYALATGSILLKTVALYAIMITGSIWEKDVFGKWLFARAFFWEDMVSMLVLGLQTTYVAALITGWGTPAEQMTIAIAAYVAYAINASQFLLKLRAARLDAGVDRRTVTAGPAAA